ncbi:hypothetical protein [Mycobacteroides chelonae]|uniref:hypothetical protein n=1 Tax=Mycobacteroides chelonae TaxID=1774 RepID=UPI001042248E|nr:hypothetical protein [Mycobacteroides chelonae]
MSRPFSNGTEWETFQWRNCLRSGAPGRECVKDRNEDCPLIAQSFADETPSAWKPNGGMGRYDCTAYEDEAAERKRLAAELKQYVESIHEPLFEV